MPEENSVQFAISELASLEEERLAAEAAEVEAAAAAKAQAEREAADRAREAEAQARRLAEAEARLSVDRELEVRDAEAEQRMATLRAELAAVRADRQRMHAQIVTLADSPTAPSAMAAEGWGWKAAFASAGIVAAGLAVILGIRGPVVETRIIEVPGPRVTAAADSPTAAPATASAPDTVAIAAPEAPEAEAAPAIASPRAPRPRGPRVTPRTPMAADPLGDLDCPEDDPTCGI